MKKLEPASKKHPRCKYAGELPLVVGDCRRRIAGRTVEPDRTVLVTYYYSSSADESPLPLQSDSSIQPLLCIMVDAPTAFPGAHRRLVGQPLLYAISVFASLGVFLVGCMS